MNFFSRILFVLLLVQTLISCQPKSVGIKDEKTEPASNSTTTLLSDKKNDFNTLDADCEKFLLKYKNWSIEYLDFLSIYQEDRYNKELNREFQKYTDEMAAFNEEWFNNHTCYLKEKFQEKYDAIGDKIEESAYQIMTKIDSTHFITDTAVLSDTLL